VIVIDLLPHQLPPITHESRKKIGDHPGKRGALIINRIDTSKKNNETAHVGWLFIQHQSNKSL
jgi:hypothetical protein